MCQSASLRIYKTIFPVDIRKDLIPLLEANPLVFVVFIDRDPRAILASSHKMDDPMNNIGEVCESMRGNLDAHHERLISLQFDEVAASPQSQLERLFSFVGLPFGV